MTNLTKMFYNVDHQVLEGQDGLQFGLQPRRGFVGLENNGKVLSESKQK